MYIKYQTITFNSYSYYSFQKKKFFFKDGNSREYFLVRYDVLILLYKLTLLYFVKLFKDGIICANIFVLI